MTAIGDWTKYQKTMLIILCDGRSAAIWLANQLKIERKEVSRHLQIMKRRGLVAANSARLWHITDKGRKELELWGRL
jgi:predicted ArsR family transcriptional regulator